MFDIRSMDERMSASLATGPLQHAAAHDARCRSGSLLAAVGIYGVVAYFVTQRTGEIGLRMALGATPGRVLRLVVGQGMRPVVLGIVVGVTLAVVASRLLASLVFGIGTRDPADLRARADSARAGGARRERGAGAACDPRRADEGPAELKRS